MKKLHLFVIRAYIGPFFLTFFIVLFILLMQFLWKYIDDLAGKGLDGSIIAELLAYASASLVPMALPLAILMASLMTFGNLGEYYELTALKASGISLQRTMLPLIILTIFISYLAFLFSNHVLPFSNLKMRSLLYDVRHQRPELQIKEGIFYNGIEGYSIKIGEKDKKTNLLKDIMIYDHTDKIGNIKVTLADSGYMKLTADQNNLMVLLYNGFSYTENQELDKNQNRRNPTYPHRRDKFKKETFFLPLDGFEFNRTDERLFKNHYQMLNLNQLESAEDSLQSIYVRRQDGFKNSLIKSNFYRKENKNAVRDEKIPNNTDTLRVTFNVDSVFRSLSKREQKTAINQALVYARSTKSYITSTKSELESRNKLIRKHQIEWHRKFTLSFACFIFFFIGAPLGAIIRKGGLGMPVVISVLFFLLYYMVSITGEKFVREGMMATFNGMWLSSYILFPLGIFLTYKATTDSTIMNLDTYSNFFKKIFQKQLMINYIAMPSKNIQQPDINKEDLVLSLRSLIFNSRRCLVEADSLIQVILFSYSFHLTSNVRYVKFSQQFNDTIKSLLNSKYVEIEYFTKLINEYPFFDVFRMKHQSKSLIYSILYYVFFPLKIIQLAAGLIKIQLFKNKFSSVINISQELIAVIENPLSYQKF